MMIIGDHFCSDFMPLNTTILSEKLQQADYRSHFIGKGHLGYQTMDHLPVNRGFDSHVGFLSGSESYHWGGGSETPTAGRHDFWSGLQPGTSIVPTLDYATNYYSKVAVDIIEGHNKSSSFFMYFAVQNVHSPYELPLAFETHDYPKMWDHTYANMLAVLDMATKNLTDALHRTGQWEDTLILWSADNGGIGRGNNHPLRGHKHDPWEGGTRATAFLTGGFLPAELRGKSSGSKLVHISDWYPTFCNLAGVDPHDRATLMGEKHDIDGVDIWPLLTGLNTTQPRALTPTSEVGLIEASAEHFWKIITLAGQSNYYYANQTAVPADKDECLAGAQHDPPEPGRTDALVTGCPVCNQTNPCLFDVFHNAANYYLSGVIGDRIYIYFNGIFQELINQNRMFWLYLHSINHVAL